MCGIAGIIRFDEKPVLQAELKRMTDAIIHRGPDGEGFYVDGSVGFAHRRLSIIDLSSAANQPMFYDDCVLIFNGEIYNYIEVREDLKRKGMTFRTASDSEVLLAAYKFWGTECVAHLNGMWSFVIHDKQRQQIFCSRDRFGKKPFFYSHNSQHFLFCSEIKGMLSLMDKPRPNWKVLTHFVALNQTDTTNESFFEGISKLPAGYNGLLDLKTGNFEVESYYRIQQHQNWQQDDEVTVVKRFSEEFERSVKWRLRSDVRVGTCLSGGLDSSFLAAVASRQYEQAGGGPFWAITAGSVDAKWDESAYARMVVDRCGLHWVHTLPDTQAFLQDFERVVYMQEEPFHSSSVYMQYFVMKAAREAGLVVLLDGQGADEVLLGYYNHIATYLHRLPITQRLKAIADIVKNYGISVNLLLQLYFYYNNAHLRKWRQLQKWQHLRSEFKNEYLDFELIQQLAKLAKGPLFEYQEYEIGTNNLPMLLRYEDKNSMAFSIESRLPFLDYRVVESVLNAPEHLRIQHGWSKYILRKAMENKLPDEIVWRKKKFGFVPPNDVWLADDDYFENMVKESKLLQRMFTTVKYPAHDRTTAWRLISVAAWERTFNIEP